ncbi:MAG: hypothetical protein HC933_13145 [Pleurocapsa sp. SU_196_0]|nr:hypothetical protein [Pleurocapsa sp. SU_196_0]
MHQIHRLNRDQPRCTMMMHPDDAAHLELTDGAIVRVQSLTSSIEVPVELSADLARGVVSLPHGYGHTRPGLGCRYRPRRTARVTTISSVTRRWMPVGTRR